MPYDQKSGKERIFNQNIAKQAHANTVNPAIHLNGAQPTGTEYGMWKHFGVVCKARQQQSIT